jgi:hypothetical protein
MWPPGYARIDADRPSHERSRRPRSKPVRFAGSVVVAAAMLALGSFPDPSRIVRGGAQPRAGSRDLVATTDDSSGPIAASRASLNKLQLAETEAARSANWIVIAQLRLAMIRQASEREKSKLTQLQEVTKAKDREIHEQRVLTLLDRTISIAEQLETKLDQAEKDREPGDQLRKEIADMTARLQSLVEQAQAENAAAKWAKLKPKVHAVAVRYLGAQAK